MAWTDALLRLQEIDLELDSLREHLFEVNTLLQDDTDLQKVRERAAEQAAEVKHARESQKDLEFELGRVETELKSVESRLYGGAIRNPRELEDMQAKAQSLRRRQNQLEESLLEAMIAREEAETQATEAQQQLETATRKWEEEHTALEAERRDLETCIAAREEEAQELARVIPSSILDSYRYLRGKMGGLAVARLKGEDCSICGIKVTSGRGHSARAGKETYCDGCGRLLVA